MSFSFFDRACLRLFDAYRIVMGYSIQPAETAAELQQCMTFFKQVFAESGYFDNMDLAKPLPDDGCTSAFAMVKRKKEIVGVIDVVRSEKQFPLQYFFNVELPPQIRRNEVAELTRFVVASSHRKKSSVVALSLLVFALRYCRQHQLRYWLMCSPALLRQGFRGFSREVDVLPQKKLLPLQIEYRRHRESFFAPRREIQVLIMDIDTVSIWNSTRTFIRRLINRVKWKIKSKLRR